MKKIVSTPVIIGLVTVVVILAGFVFYRSQLGYDPPAPMQRKPPRMPPLVQGADGRMRPATSP